MADHGKKSPDQVEGKAVADTGPARLVRQYDIDATRIPWPAPGYLQRQTLGPTKYPTPLVARKGATNNKQIPDRRQLAKDSGDKQTTNFSKFSQKIEQTRVPEDKQTNATKDKQIRNSKTGGIKGRETRNYVNTMDLSIQIKSRSHDQRRQQIPYHLAHTHCTKRIVYASREKIMIGLNGFIDILYETKKLPWGFTKSVIYKLGLFVYFFLNFMYSVFTA